MPESLNVSKEEILLLLKEAFSSGVFSYIDLAESECQKIFNKFIECKLNIDDLSTINLKLNKKNSTSFSNAISTNYFYNYTTSWDNTYQ